MNPILGTAIALLGIVVALSIAGFWWRTELRQTEGRLRRTKRRAKEVEARLDWISRYSNDVMLLLDVDGWIVDANERLTETYGYARSEVLGQPIGKLSAASTGGSARPEELLRDILRDGSAIFESVHVRKDGSEVPVEVNARRLDVDDGTFLICSVRDITERKQQGERLRRSEAAHRALFDAVPHPMCVYDLGSLRILGANDAGVAQFGYPRDELLRMTVTELLAPREEARLREHVARNGTAPLLLSGLWESRRRDGTTFSTEVVSHSVTIDGRAARIVVATDVTQRLRVENALHASEARYRALFRSNPHPMWAYDLETLAFLAVNDRAISQYGYSEAEFLSMTIADIRPPEDVERLKAHVRQYSDEVLSDSGIWTHRTRDGRLIDVEIVSHAMTLSGRPARIVLAHDVTRRLAAERALQASEERYRKLFEQANDAIVELDLTGGIHAVNDEAARIFGYSRDELVGRNLRDVVPEFERPRLEHLLAATLAASTVRVPYDGRWNLVRRDGDSFVAKVRARALENGMVIVVVHDLTEYLTVQRSLERQRDLYNLLSHCSHAVTRGESRDALLAEVTELAVRHGPFRIVTAARIEAGGELHDIGHLFRDDGVVASLREGRSVVCNGGWSAAWEGMPGGGTAPGVVGSAAVLPVFTRGEATHALLFCSSETDVFDEEIVKTLEQVAAEVSFGIDALATRRDLAAAYADLELKVEERTRDLAEAKDRAEAADRAKSAFLSSVSHELRSPLHSIIGFTSVLLEGIGGPLNEAQREHVDVVRDSAQHLLSIINDLLDISRIEAGAMVMVQAPYSPDDVLRRVMQRFRIEADAKGLEFRLETDGSRARATGDERRAEQVITNLVSNAIKYTVAGGVLVRSGVVGDRLVIHVEDTGRGIPAEEQDRIFARFTQLDPEAGRLAEGTGLGLAIARGLAGAMGGRIEVVSEPGRGSRFTLHLPLGATQSVQDGARLAG